MQKLRYKELGCLSYAWGTRGPKTKEGQTACKKAPFQHGCYSHEAIKDLRFLRSLTKDENLLIKKTDPTCQNSLY